MKRLFTRIPSALARLAFWRKPAADEANAASADPAPAQDDVAPAESPSAGNGPELFDASETETVAPSPARPDRPVDLAETADLAPEPPSFFARLTAKLRRPKAESPDASTPVEPAAAVEAGSSEADPSLEPAPPSFLARLTAKLRRRPEADTQAADDAEVAVTRDEAADEEDASGPRGFRRVLALLSRKIVWIPAASVVLLAVVGTLSALLWQAGQDRTALEAKLKAAEQQLQRTATPQPRAAGSTTPPSGSAEPSLDAVAAPAAGPRPSLAGGDCDINNAESVSLRLKDCIEAFNLETARPARATQAKP